MVFVSRVKCLSYELSYNLKFWNIGRVLIPNICCFFCIIILFEVTHIWRPQKMTNKWPPHFHHPQKWTIDIMFKIMKSSNTWQFLRTPLLTPILWRHHKCMFPFWFCKFWSVTCLNANEISSFIKIQLSYLLPSYQINQAFISNYISYFLNFLVSLCQ